MAHTIAGVVIQNNDRYLLVQEALPKCYGQWNWPAGHVDDGETPEQAAVREAKEEVGLGVVISGKLGEWYDEDAGRTRILFGAESYSGQVAVRPDEILGYAWLTREQIVALRDSLRVQDWMLEVLSKEGSEQ